MLSFYQILQVKETASDIEIKQAYRKLGKVLHPDVNGNTAEATVMFRLLNEAYETLSDPLKRKAYDVDPNPMANDASRIESYKLKNKKQSDKLKEYEDQLKKYKETVYLKSKRESELIKEVEDLKRHNLENEQEILAKKEYSQELKGISWSGIILIIIGLNLAMLIIYMSILNNLEFLFD